MIERVERIAEVRTNPAAPADLVRHGLIAVREIEAWCAAQHAGLVTQLRPVDSFPEKTIADAAKTSLSQAAKTTERSATLDATPSLASALSNGTITAAHIDAVTRTSKRLDGDKRTRLIERADALAAVAASSDGRPVREAVGPGGQTARHRRRFRTLGTPTTVPCGHAPGSTPRACGTSPPASTRSPGSRWPPGSTPPSNRCSPNPSPTTAPPIPSRNSSSSPPMPSPDSHSTPVSEDAQDVRSSSLSSMPTHQASADQSSSSRSRRTPRPSARHTRR